MYMYDDILEWEIKVRQEWWVLYAGGPMYMYDDILEWEIKVWQEWRVLYAGGPMYMYDDILEWKIFRTKVVEEVKTHTVCSVTVFWKMGPFVTKCGENAVETKRPLMTI